MTNDVVDGRAVSDSPWRYSPPRGGLTLHRTSGRLARKSESRDALDRAPTEPVSPMSRDILSDLLRAVRLRGAAFYYVSFRGHWSAGAGPAKEIAAEVMPGCDHV